MNNFKESFHAEKIRSPSRISILIMMSRDLHCVSQRMRIVAYEYDASNQIPTPSSFPTWPASVFSRLFLCSEKLTKLEPGRTHFPARICGLLAGSARRIYLG